MVGIGIAVSMTRMATKTTATTATETAATTATATAATTATATATATTRVYRSITVSLLGAQDVRLATMYFRF